MSSLAASTNFHIVLSSNLLTFTFLGRGEGEGIGEPEFLFSSTMFFVCTRSGLAPAYLSAILFAILA